MDIYKFLDVATGIALVIVAILQFKLLRQANGTALNALTEAQKASEAAATSADAFFESQRGRMAYVNQGMQENPYTLRYRFRNIGNAGVIVHQFQILTDLVQAGAEAPVMSFGRLGERYVAVPAGYLLATDVGDGIVHIEPFETRITQEAFKQFAKPGAMISTQYYIVYETMNRRYTLRHTMLLDPNTNRSEHYKDDAFNFETWEPAGPVSKQAAPGAQA